MLSIHNREMLSPPQKPPLYSHPLSLIWKHETSVVACWGKGGALKWRLEIRSRRLTGRGRTMPGFRWKSVQSTSHEDAGRLTGIPKTPYPLVRNLRGATVSGACRMRALV